MEGHGVRPVEWAFAATSIFFFVYAAFRGLLRSNAPDGVAQRVIFISWFGPLIREAAVLFEQFRTGVNDAAAMEILFVAWSAANMLVAVGLWLISDAVSRAVRLSALFTWIWVVVVTGRYAPFSLTDIGVLMGSGAAATLCGMRLRWLSLAPARRGARWWTQR